MLGIKQCFSKIRSGSLRTVLQETRWIYQYVRRYRRTLVIYVLLGLLTTGLSLGSSLATKALIDVIQHHLAGHTTDRLYFAVVVVCCVGLAVFNILATSYVSRFSARVNLKINNEIRADVYRKFMQTDLESVQRFHSGDLLARINTDVTNVADSVLGWVPSLIVDLTRFLAFLFVILYYDPSMALFALISAPLTLLVSRTLMRKMRRHNQKLRQVSSQMMAFHEESLQNIQPIKAFNLTDFFYERMLSLQKSYADTFLDYNRFSVLTAMFMSLAGLITSYVCLGWAAFRLWNGAITFGTMVLFLQLAGYLRNAFSSLVSLIPTAITATVSAQRIMSVLELPREQMPYRRQVEQLRISKAPINLEIQKLSFRYQTGEMILRQMDLHVRNGQMIAIVGASGSGKTTLFRILLGLLNYQAERADACSDSAHYPISASTRALFSYVPQDNVIFTGTVRSMLQLTKPEASDEELWAVLKTACAEDFVRNLPKGLDSDLHERGVSLSGGQNQRLAIARALLSDAPILLFDEVTAALDQKTEQQLLANISRTYAGRTCIVSTHRPSVLPLCDSVYRLENGRLEAVR